MAWSLLIGAGVLEIVMAVALRFSAGWSKPIPSALGVAAAMASVFLLTHALKFLPTGVAYAIWTGMGSVGVALIGIFFLGEQASVMRMACIALIVAGMIGLRLSDPIV
ncbi:MAG TPA: multidrug efflux SMR transporter [Burkholderiales bacterium]|nr:multidrug efflux SMR transporter [Burkholderiales bacterium]